MQLPKPPRVKNRRFFEITKLERAARSQGFSKIAGVDEAGRGPLAGPVVAAACTLPEDFFIKKIDDSKRLSPAQREEMFATLMAHPGVRYGIGTVEAFMIDQINILQATLQAMAAAIAQLNPEPDFILVDGDKSPSIPISCQTVIQTVIRGDSLSQSIMAAAIIAKVTRDRQMAEYDKQYPQYGFSSHKGYATPEHLAALDKWGPCPLHRESYKPVKAHL